MSDILWRGESSAAKFRVGCVPGIAPGRVKCEAVLVEGSRMKRLFFDIEVTGPEFMRRELGNGKGDEVELDTVMDKDNGMVEETTLADSLGPGPSTYTSISHAVELELQAGSLADEVLLPVKVTPSLKFVECRAGGLGR